MNQQNETFFRSIRSCFFDAEFVTILFILPLKLKRMYYSTLLVVYQAVFNIPFILRREVTAVSILKNSLVVHKNIH